MQMQQCCMLLHQASPVLSYGKEHAKTVHLGHQSRRETGLNSIIVDRMREGGEAVRGRLHPSIREDGVLVCMQHSGRPGLSLIHI